MTWDPYENASESLGIPIERRLECLGIPSMNPLGLLLKCCWNALESLLKCIGIPRDPYSMPLEYIGTPIMQHWLSQFCRQGTLGIPTDSKRWSGRDT